MKKKIKKRRKRKKNRIKKINIDFKELQSFKYTVMNINEAPNHGLVDKEGMANEILTEFYTQITKLVINYGKSFTFRQKNIINDFMKEWEVLIGIITKQPGKYVFDEDRTRESEEFAEFLKFGSHPNNKICFY